jgi:hypothetical protein
VFRIYPIKVTFMGTPLEGLDAEYVTVLHRVNAMDVARIRLNVAYDEISQFVSAGSALLIEWGHKSRNDQFPGYVHSFRPGTEGYVRHTEVVAISTAYPMFNESGRTLYDVPIEYVAQLIGDDYRFQVETEKHPYRNSQILQKGESDWSLLVRLGQQWGYVTMVTGVTLIFRPLLSILEENYAQSIPARTFTDASTPGAQIISFERTYSATESASLASVAFTGVDPVNLEVISQKAEQDGGVFEEIDTSRTVTSDVEGELRIDAIRAAKQFPFTAKAVMFAPYKRRPLDVYRIVNDGTTQTWVVLSVKHIVTGDDYRAEMLLGSDGEDHGKNYSGPQRLDVPTLLKQNRRSRRPVPVIVQSRPYYLGTGANAVVNDQRWKAQVMTVPVEDKEAS